MFGCNGTYRFETPASLSVPGVFSRNESAATVDGADVYNLSLCHCRNRDTWEESGEALLIFL